METLQSHRWRCPPCPPCPPPQSLRQAPLRSPGPARCGVDWWAGCPARWPEHGSLRSQGRLPHGGKHQTTRWMEFLMFFRWDWCKVAARNSQLARIGQRLYFTNVITLRILICTDYPDRPRSLNPKNQHLDLHPARPTDRSWAQGPGTSKLQRLHPAPCQNPASPHVPQAHHVCPSLRSHLGMDIGQIWSKGTD